MKKFVQYIEEEAEFYRHKEASEETEKFLHDLFYSKGVDEKTQNAFVAWRRTPHEPQSLDFFSNLVPNTKNVSPEKHAENIKKGLFSVLGSPHRFFKTKE